MPGFLENNGCWAGRKDSIVVNLMVARVRIAAVKMGILNFKCVVEVEPVGLDGLEGMRREGISVSPRILPLVTEGTKARKIEREVWDAFKIHVGFGYMSRKLRTESWAWDNKFTNWKVQWIEYMRWCGRGMYIEKRRPDRSPGKLQHLGPVIEEQ